MTEADIGAVGELHVRSWQSAYAGLVPQSHLDGLDVAEHTERRRRHFAAANGQVDNLVAEEAAGRVVGWATLGPYRSDEGEESVRTDDGEVYSLYLLPEQIGRGIGRALAEEVRRRAEVRGFGRLRLWVLEENTRARRFYERAGYAFDGGREPFTVGGVDVPEVRYTMALDRPAP